MRSLLLRIFVICWVTNLAVIVVFMVMAAWIGFLPGPAHGPGFPGNHVIVAGQVAVSILAREDREAVQQYLAIVEQVTGSPIFVLNDRGEDVLDRPVPQPAERMAQQIRDGERSKMIATSAGLWVGDFVPDPKGGKFIAVGMLLPPTSKTLFELPGPLAMPMLGIIVTAGVIAFVLAHYITGPVRKLRSATQQFATGNLAARAAQSVVRRKDAIGDLGREFDLMASRVEALMTSQQRLLRDVSHELRSPLARLNVALGIARRKAGTEASDALVRIEQEAEQLNALIGQLLALSRLESLELVAELAELQLLALVEEVVSDANFEGEQDGRMASIVKRESCIVRGVQQLLRSAVENVLRNAISYTAPGSKVEVAISMRAEQGRPHGVVSIRDYGPGIPEEHLLSIFRPFHRVDDARDRNRGGAGLGLAIADRAMRVHGGWITASNALGGGLLVELFVPAAIATRTDDPRFAKPQGKFRRSWQSLS